MLPWLVVAYHGILTGQTSRSWPDAFDAWMLDRYPDVKVLKCEYPAGPFPVWNHFVKNPRLARARANEIEEILRYGPRRIGMVGHSNGTHIEVLTARELARRGIATEVLITTGSVLHPSVRKNGILDLMEAGMLERAYAYCSGGDLPLRIPGFLRWPYGSLGRRGWADVPEWAEDRIVERWFAGGHSAYFAEDRRVRTFERIAGDLFGA